LVGGGGTGAVASSLKKGRGGRKFHSWKDIVGEKIKLVVLMQMKKKRGRKDKKLHRQ